MEIAHPHRPLSKIAWPLVISLCTSPVALAGTFTWDASGGAPLNDGSGSWNASGGTNWYDGSTFGAWGNSPTDDAVFGVSNGAAGVVSVGNVNVNDVTFNAAGSGSYSLDDGQINLAGSSTPTLTVNAANAAISSTLTGTMGLGKSGTGTLLLTGTNTYSGTTSINSGELVLGSDSAIGSSALQFGGGAVSSTGALGGTRVINSAFTQATNGSFKIGGTGSNNDRFIFTNNFNPAANAQLNAGTSTTLRGTLGSGNRLWINAGILTINGDNSSFTGGLRLGNGGFGFNSTIVIGNNNAIGSSGNIRFDGGMLQHGAGVTTDFSNRVDLTNSSSFSIHTGGNNITYNTAFTPVVTTGEFSKMGQGTLTLNSSIPNTFTARINVYGGALLLDYSNMSSPTNLVANQPLSLRGGTLVLKGHSTIATSQSFTAAALDINSAGSSNSIILDKNNGPGVTLNLHANAFARNTGAELHFDVTGGGTINYARAGAATLTYATVKDGAHTRFARYTGTNIIQAPTTALTTSTNASTTDFITSGNLALNSGSHAIFTLVMDVTSSNGSLDLSTSNLRSGGFLLSGDNNYSITSSGGGVVFGGAAEVNYLTMGTGTLTLSANTAAGHIISKGGPGTLFLNGAKAYTGGTYLSQGTIAADNSGSLGTGSITVGGDSTLRAEGNISLANNISIDGRTLNDSKAVTARYITLNTQANDMTLTGVVSGGGGIIKTGTGLLTLGGVNTYLGGTTISQGTLAVSISENLGDTKFTPMTVNGGTLRINGTSLANIDNRAVNWESFHGGLDVADPNHTFTVANNLGGSGSLTKSGSGKLVLTGTNTHTGSTTVSAGTLLISSGSMNSTSQINLNGGVFNYNSTTGLSRNVIVNGGNFKYNSSAAYTGTLTVNSGTISGNGNLGSTSLNIGNGVILAPGNSPGTTNSGTETWASLGTYQWEINKVNGTKGNDPGWDWANIAGNLNITATTGSKFTIDIVGLNLSNSSGAVNGFDNTQNYSWTIASVTGSILGFDTSLFNLTTGNFTDNNPIGTGTFSISQVGSDIKLNYASVPEPSAWRLLLLGAATIPLRRRFRRCPAPDSLTREYRCK